MSLELVSELWNHIKLGMPKVDRESTADFIVNMLVENGFDSEEIRDAFIGDATIKNSIIEYFGDEEVNEKDINDLYDDYDDYDDEDVDEDDWN
jgi:hypothetical protein